MDKLEQYLNEVCRSIGGPRSLRQHVRQELREHLQDAAAEHKAAGLSEEAALDRALEDFGKPEQVRSELEATHGHRLMAVVVDRAMQWKERTMRAKWLWTTWAYLAVAGVVVVEVLFYTFSTVYLLPKLRKIQSDGWLDVDAVNLPVMARLDSFLHALKWMANNATWCLLAAVGVWGLFEWRVRSENKPFMRLAAFGTTALGLALGGMILAGALVLPFMVGLPGSRIARPWAVEAVASVNKSVATLEQALAKKDWAAMQEHASQASRALNRLEAGPSLLALTTRNEPPTVDELRTRLAAAKDSLREAEQAIREKNAEGLAAAVQRFLQQYGPVAKAAARPES